MTNEDTGATAQLDAPAAPGSAPRRRSGKTAAAHAARNTAAKAAGNADEETAVAPATKSTSKPARKPATKAAAKADKATAPVKARKRAPAAAPDVAGARPEHAQPIYQIYFEPRQLDGLDPAFIPLNNAGHDDPLREFAVFERLAADEGLRLAPLWGAVSWRFASKTGLSGEALRHAIAAHPGQDLYFCNPFPEHEALYINGWQQGATSHPAFQELCKAVLNAAGVDEAEINAVQSSKSFSACNYFVGSPTFWAAYLPWVRGVLNRARPKLPAPVLRVLDSRLSDPKNQHAGSTYWPFIVERLLPLFLRSAGQGLKVHKLSLPAAEARLNTHLQRLREMKDVAHRTHSRWLYACWLNYRNLYFLQTAGPYWCKRNLPMITATEFDFR
jgi:hypothetical protein